MRRPGILRSLASALDRLSQRTILLGLGVGAIGGAIGLVALVSSNGLPLPAYTFKVTVPAETPPLKVSDPVRVAGKNAGTVKALKVTSEGLELTVSMDGHYAPIGRDAKVRVRTLVGTSLAFLALEPGETSQPLSSGGVLSSRDVVIGSSLPQALEAFDRETREAVSRNTVVLAAGARGRGTQLNRLSSDVAALSRTGVPLLKAAVPRPGVGTQAIRDGASVSGALAGERPDDVGALISSTSTIVAAASRQRTELRDGLRRAADLQRDLPGALDDLDKTSESAAVLLEQMRPAARAVNEQVDDVQAILDAGPALRRDVVRLTDQARPALKAFAATLSLFEAPAAGVQPMFEALANLGRGLGPYRPELLALSAGLISATSTKWGGDRPVLRAGLGLGCHASRNATPAPGAVANDRKAC